MGSLPHKFPRTPHLFGSRSTREDKVLSESETRELLNLPLQGEEKIDGANLGIGFSEESGELVVQNRGHVLGRGEHAQFAPLWSLLAERQTELRSVLGTRFILFGEWCYARHSIAYSTLPNYFLAFDLYDKTTREFHGRAALELASERVALPTVPVLFHATVLRTIAKLKEHLRTSRFSHETAEGIYLRHERNGKLVGRYKYVREDFLPGTTEHWQSRPIEPNRVAR